MSFAFNINFSEAITPFFVSACKFSQWLFLFWDFPHFMIIVECICKCNQFLFFSGFSFRYSKYCRLGIMFIQHGIMLEYFTTPSKNKEIVCLLGYRMRRCVHQIDTSCICLLVKGRQWSGNGFQGFFGCVFCLFFFWWGWAMKAVCSTQTKGVFTLSRYKNALFGWSHLQNCPEKHFLFFFPISSLRSAATTRRTVIEALSCCLVGFVKHIHVYHRVPDAFIDWAIISFIHEKIN